MVDIGGIGSLEKCHIDILSKFYLLIVSRV